MNISIHKLRKADYCNVCSYDCHKVCPIYKLIDDEKLTPQNKVFDALKILKKEISFSYSVYACYDCKKCTLYCPHKVDVAEILNFTRERIIVSGKAKEFIFDFEEKFYSELENMDLKFSNGDLIVNNPPDFLKFYYLGYRDETITEIKNLLKNYKPERIVCDDKGLLYIIKKLKKTLKPLKIPKLLLKRQR